MRDHEPGCAPELVRHGERQPTDRANECSVLTNNADSGAIICPFCNNVRRIHLRGRCAGPCPNCSFVLARYRACGDGIWSAPVLLTYYTALNALGNAIRGGARASGQLRTGKVEYVTLKPAERHWELLVLPHEEGMAWRAAHEKAISVQNTTRLARGDATEARGQRARPRLAVEPPGVPGPGPWPGVPTTQKGRTA